MALSASPQRTRSSFTKHFIEMAYERYRNFERAELENMFPIFTRECNSKPNDVVIRGWQK